ncbi:hypothetical protein EVAR_41359_1 [Eumeta japonica]|uniref:Uncharacterized protein n=1 Tax=Eumeta variegata TaxID=151549 RepID=A0A4C1XQU1_EUMVA|nr:hypothetical protein EVAR_41359_1 [Eumeta japonica]
MKHHPLPTVHKCFNEFQPGRTNLTDDLREGCPSTATTEVNSNDARYMIEADKRAGIITFPCSALYTIRSRVALSSDKSPYDVGDHRPLPKTAFGYSPDPFIASIEDGAGCSVPSSMEVDTVDAEFNRRAHTTPSIVNIITHGA